MVEGFALHYDCGYLGCYSTLWPALLNTYTPVGFFDRVDDGLAIERAEGPVGVKNVVIDCEYM